MQIISFLLAAVGVCYFTIDYGRFPWVAIVLALSFGIYGLLKKKMNFNSIAALAVETTLIMPAALIYMTYLGSTSSSVFFSDSLFTGLLLISTGIFTLLPLYFFGLASVRVPLHLLGFFQYIAPTLTLLIGVFIYNEVFTLAHAVCFGFI